MHTEKEFFKYIDQIIEYTGIDRAEIFNGCYDIYHSIHFTANDLLQMATNLQVDPVKLWTRSLDLETLKNARIGSIQLPSSYSEVCASSIVSLKSSLHQFNKYGLYDYALKKIQMDEKTIDGLKSISVLAGYDLLTYGSGFLTQRDYIDIGRRNAEVSYENFLKNEINSHSSAIKIGEYILETACHYEQNWTYKIIRSDLNSVIIESRESELMKSAKAYRSFTSDMTNLIRFSFIKTALEKFNIETEKITPLSDWNNRDKKFQFSINLR